MRITGKFIKLTRREAKTITEFCLDVLSATPRVESAPQGVKAFLMARHAESRSDELATAAKALLVSLIQRTDLWSESFFHVANVAHDFDKLFGVEAPDWFCDPDKRSKAYEQFRGITDMDTRNRIQQRINCEMIADVASRKGIRLNHVGITLPDTSDILLDSVVERWRNAERDKSKRYRAGKVSDRAEAAEAVAAIPEDATRLALMQRIETLEEEKRALQRQVAALQVHSNRRPAYVAAQQAAIAETLASPLFEEIERLQLRLEHVEQENSWLRQANRAGEPPRTTGYRRIKLSPKQGAWMKRREEGHYDAD